MACRICLEDTGVLIQPCACQGFDHGSFHEKCLEEWVNISGNIECKVCAQGFKYEEQFACNLKRYCKNFMLPESTPTPTFFYGVIGISLLCISSLGVNEIVSFSMVAFSFSLTGALFQQIIYRNENLFFFDLLLIWKFAVTVAIFGSSLLFLSDVTERCYEHCSTKYMKVCDSSCPVIAVYDKEHDFIMLSILEDFIIFVSIFVIRLFARCFTHMRKAKYSNYQKLEEV